MDLYFSPLACSMATRIAFYEAGHDANYLEVDPATKRVQNDGSDFFKVNPLDPTIYFAVGGLLALVATASCFFPARRATRVDPMVALRYE